MCQKVTAEPLPLKPPIRYIFYRHCYHVGWRLEFNIPRRLEGDEGTCYWLRMSFIYFQRLNCRSEGNGESWFDSGTSYTYFIERKNVVLESNSGHVYFWLRVPFEWYFGWLWLPDCSQNFWSCNCFLGGNLLLTSTFGNLIFSDQLEILWRVSGNWRPSGHEFPREVEVIRSFFGLNSDYS